MKDFLPENFETKKHCKSIRKKIYNAALLSKKESATGFFLPETCRKNDQCQSGLCPLCMRRFRSGFLRFANDQNLHKREWLLVTIFVDGWTMAPGDFSPFGELKNNNIIRRLIQGIRRLGIPDTLIFGCIETVLKIKANIPIEKPFHLHLMVSGPQKPQLIKCIKKCIPLVRTGVPVRCDHVQSTKADFIKAASYIMKQSFWKRSESADGHKALQYPTQHQLAELGSNMGAHDVGKRFFYIGIKTSGRKFILT